MTKKNPSAPTDTTEEVVNDGSLQNYFFPDFSRSIQAASPAEALELLNAERGTSDNIPNTRKEGDGN